MEKEFVFYDKNEKPVYLGDTCYCKLVDTTSTITKRDGKYYFDNGFLVNDYSDHIELVAEQQK